MAIFKDSIDYKTGIAMLDVKGLGLLCAYGGPHKFPSEKWKGDAGIIIYDGSDTYVKEYPNVPVSYHQSGPCITMELPCNSAPKHIAFTKITEAYSNQGFGSPRLPKKANSALHKLFGGLNNTVALANYAGLESVIVGGNRYEVAGGALSLEHSAGTMLAPYALGTAWAYQSWLYANANGAASCGQVTDAFSSLANPTGCERLAKPFVDWLTKHLVDSGVEIKAYGDRKISSQFRHDDFSIPLNSLKVTGNFATVRNGKSEKNIDNIIGSAVIIPFKEYAGKGKARHIVRLHCLTSVYESNRLLGRGPGLVEIPVTLDRALLPAQLTPARKGDD
ncbi:MAG: hypothetical protein AABY09_03620, partial [Nanoarchaeota archaeon]